MKTMSAINTNPLSYLQSLLSNALQGTSETTKPTTNQTTTSASSSIGQQQDSTQLSPLAQLLSTLQQLQQSNPTQYAQVTQQIATNLQAAAQTAASDGNTAAANQLSTLATDFSNASTSGQLPNIADLAQAVGGHGHGHHHSHGASSDSDSSTDTSSSSASTSSTNTALSQFLASLNASGADGANGTQNDSLNPIAIIFNTLATAGVTSSNA
jgi:hypothetical protein